MQKRDQGQPPRLTATELRVLGALEDLSERGWAPTYREMLEHLGWSPKSKGSLHQYLRRLRDDLGVIAGSGRSLRVLPVETRNDRSDDSAHAKGAGGITHRGHANTAQRGDSARARRRRAARPFGRERAGRRPDAARQSRSGVGAMDDSRHDSGGLPPDVTALFQTILRASRRVPKHSLPPAEQITWWDRGVRDGVETAMVYAEEALRATADAIRRGDLRQAQLITGFFETAFDMTELPRRDDGRLDQTNLIVEDEQWTQPLAGPNLQLIDALREAAAEALGQPGQMIAPSKTEYGRAYPDHVVVFNANLCVVPAIKIWWGDIDLSTDAESRLQELARKLDRALYVLYERDGRFEGRDRKPLLESAVYVAKPDGTTVLSETIERSPNGTLRKKTRRRQR
jgi:hypothetical protein